MSDLPGPEGSGWFGTILHPQSDYPYEWLLGTLYMINEHLAKTDDLNFNEKTIIEAHADTDFQKLTDWLHDHPTNIQYLRAIKKTNRTKQEQLAQAQRNAITATVYLISSNVKRLIIKENTEDTRIPKVSPIAMNYLRWIHF